MIYPKSVLNILDGRFFVWIGGENRTGKTALSLDIASYYLDDGYRLASNLLCKWNDDLDGIRIEENNMLNVVVLLDEGGVYVRTKETIRNIMGFKGKLRAYFIMASTESPHEDLWRFSITPAEGFNWLVEFLFGSWFYENILKVWRWEVFNPNPKRPDKGGLFFQFFPKNYYRIYSTLNPFNDAESILSTFQAAIHELHNKITGRGELVKLQDLATGKSGMGESQSFFQYQVSKKVGTDKRGLFTHIKKGK